MRSLQLQKYIRTRSLIADFIFSPLILIVLCIVLNATRTILRQKNPLLVFLSVSTYVNRTTMFEKITRVLQYRLSFDINRYCTVEKRINGACNLYKCIFFCLSNISSVVFYVCRWICFCSYPMPDKREIIYPDCCPRVNSN